MFRFLLDNVGKRFSLDVGSLKPGIRDVILSRIKRNRDQFVHLLNRQLRNLVEKMQLESYDTMRVDLAKPVTQEQRFRLKCDKVWPVMWILSPTDFPSDFPEGAQLSVFLEDSILCPDETEEETQVDFLVDDRNDGERPLDLGTSDLSGLRDADEFVIRKTEIAVVFSYPFSTEVTRRFKAKDKRGFRRGELARLIINAYKQIYAEEERASPPRAQASLNRSSTAGPYGIWGHALDDLVLLYMFRDNGEYRLAVE